METGITQENSSGNTKGIFGSIPEPEPVMHEVIHQWMPLWSYHLDEIQEIKDSCISYTHDTYTMLEEFPLSTNFFDK